MQRINVAMICKLMPYYRLGIFQELSSVEEGYQFSFFGDTVEQGGIKQIPFSHADAERDRSIRWIRTKNYFYRPEALLWQTGIIKEIFGSKFKIFVFEGGIRHLPIWLYALLCKMNNKKVFFWTHGNRGLDNRLSKFIRKVFFDRLSDGLLLYGHFQRNLMIEEGYKPDKLFVIYNSLRPEQQFKMLSALDKNDVEKSKSKLFREPKRTTLIFIGRLVEHKGVMKILEAIDALQKEKIIANCIFIGKGPRLKAMQDFCKKNKLEKQIFFTGALYEERQIAHYFAMSDLMVSPNNVGLNCIHSLAYGVPVLTHDDFRYQNPEVESLEEGKTGFFFDHNNMDAMLLKMKYFITSKFDKEEQFKACQKSVNDKYNPTHQANCIIEAFNKSQSSRE